ncbi:M48 family metalloprotease [Hahella aquimaris]|uniref:M48 family metalloprotease n=1 Tax=Hahella sp. HNIBRBA332 TaxID=3015983 RepID=UPI00273C19A0|nr:M48 family metalloprotease [Hahella sp. HNIBRBA332]WLQ14939.1 M48 family metalloprotease [Hahella sp. HNIBRBA332]
MRKKYLFPLLLSLTLPPAIHADESTLPELGDSSGAIITPAQEQALGQAWLRSLRSQLPTYADPLLTVYVRDLIYKLAPNSELQDHNLTTVVVDSNILNAFAVPGGVIGVNAGLFLYAQSEQEMAGVLAHEIAHLSQRHFARRLEESKMHTALNMAGILASVIIAATAGSDAGVAALASTQAYSIQEQLSYSRQNEQEADRLGLETLAASGMEPRAMSSMFEKMLRNNRYAQQFPEYLRTHPLTESRVSDTAARAANYPSGAYKEDPDYYIMQSRVLLHYAKNAEDAFNLFKAQSTGGTGNSRLAALYGQVISASKVERPQDAKEAMEQLLKIDGNRISIVVAYADWLAASKRNDEAIQLLNKHLQRNPSNYPLSMDLARLLNQRGDHKEAERLLRGLTSSYGAEPSLWYELAETHGLAGSIAELHQARAEYFYLTGNISKATQQLRQALSKSEGNYQRMAVIQKRMKDFAEAGKEFKF